MSNKIEQVYLPIYRGKIKNVKEAYGNILSREYVNNCIEGCYFNCLGVHFKRYEIVGIQE